MARKTVEEERFSIEQRKQLAILHDDIDEFNDRFLANFAENIVYTITPSPSLGKVSRKRVKPKKSRHVFAVDFTHLPEEVARSGSIFQNRMMIITENISVKSIVDKLIVFYENAGRMTISFNRSHRVFTESLTKIEGQLEVIKGLEDPIEDTSSEINVLEELLSFMRDNNQSMISGRSYSDHITYSLYSEKEEMVASRSFFRGGIVIPRECVVREPVPRKPRSDNKENNHRVIAYGNKSYVMDKTTQYSGE